MRTRIQCSTRVYSTLPVISAALSVRIVHVSLNSCILTYTHMHMTWCILRKHMHVIMSCIIMHLASYTCTHIIIMHLTLNVLRDVVTRWTCVRAQRHTTTCVRRLHAFLHVKRTYFDVYARHALCIDYASKNTRLNIMHHAMSIHRACDERHTQNTWLRIDTSTCTTHDWYINK